MLKPGKFFYMELPFVFGEQRARTRQHGPGVYTPKETRNHRADIRAQAQRLYGIDQAWSADEAVGLVMQALVPIPASTSKKRRAEMIGAPCIRKPDLDNVEKLVCDALIGLFYADDKQVTNVTKERLWWEGPARTVLFFYSVH